MIKDKLCNAEIYYKLSKNLETAFLWLKKQSLQSLKDGKYEIDGNKVYANVQEYVTKDSAKYEAHREYIDIQYVIEGEELVGVLDLNDCIACEEYNQEKDIIFLDTENDDEYQKLTNETFLILFPTDAHKPSIKIDENKTVKKIVVKVSVN